MGIFVDYPTNIFSGIRQTPTVIATADPHVLWVTALIVCNRGAAPVRFNLQKARLQGTFLEKTCYAATTANLVSGYDNGTSGIGATLVNSGTLAQFTVDGLTPAKNARILVKSQTDPVQNGIYVLTSQGSGVAQWVLKRAVDFTLPSQINVGDVIRVSNGTTNGSTLWEQQSIVTAIGTSPITFTTVLSNSIFIINELEIKPYTTVDIVDITGVLQLNYDTQPFIRDSLICFTNGYTQIIDCEVNYAQLNELP